MANNFSPCLKGNLRGTISGVVVNHHHVLEKSTGLSYDLINNTFLIVSGDNNPGFLNSGVN